MTEPDRQALTTALARGVVDLDGVPDRAIEPLIDYLLLLHRWNRAYNLSAVREPRAMVSRHLLDSLVILPWLQGPRLIDVGSGAGLPGLPIALCRPDLDVVLLDSNGKKARFLQQVVAELDISNARVVHGRVEAYRPEQPFHCIVSRAFARLDTMVGLTRHLLAPGGCMLAMKGRFDAAAEAPDLAERITVIDVVVPGLDEARCLVRIPAEVI